MTVYNELNKIAYIGNTSQKLYPIPFEYINTEDIKVSIYTSKNEFVEDWRCSTQYVIEGGNVKVLSGYAIDKNKKLLILRRVDLVQDNKYREGGDFPAKSTETSFDKLTMITQQLQETLDRCVKVEVLDNQTPDELLEEVYNKLDSATEVAEQAIGAANQATTAAKDAKDAVVVAQQQITETQAFIEQARADINQTVEDSIEYVEQEAVKAATEVVGEVVGKYTDRAETAAVSAEADANSAATSAASASANAIKAETNADEVAVYNFKNKITNCITEIPQDIKLELNNGTLTLKAGSKVYVPNGAGKFDEVVVSSDRTTTGFVSGEDLVFYNRVTNNFTIYGTNRIYSGTSAPTGILSGNNLWYNTTDNKIKQTTNGGTSWADIDISLPIAKTTGDSSKLTSIDQVFNGFGYIGSTVFALPGVKGLIPNGKNEDGSLKNAEFTVSKVSTVQAGSTSAGYIGFVNGTLMRRYSGNSVYDESKNIWYSPETGNSFQFLYCGDFSETSAKITSFTPKCPFRAVDRNDFNKLDEEVVKTSGNQTVGGTKTFTTSPKIVNPSGQNTQLLLSDATANSEIGVIQATSNGKNQFIIRFGNGNKYPFVISQDVSDSSKFTYHLIGSPPASDNSTQIATTGWVNANFKNNLIPNVGSKVDIITAVSSTNGYTAPSSGFVSVQTNVNGTTTTLSVGGQVVAQAHQYSGDSHGSESKQLFALVGKGQVVKTSQAVQFGVFVPFK